MSIIWNPGPPGGCAGEERVPCGLFSAWACKEHTSPFLPAHWSEGVKWLPALPLPPDNKCLERNRRFLVTCNLAGIIHILPFICLLISNWDAASLGQNISCWLSFAAAFFTCLLFSSACATSTKMAQEKSSVLILFVMKVSEESTSNLEYFLKNPYPLCPEGGEGSNPTADWGIVKERKKV